MLCAGLILAPVGWLTQRYLISHVSGARLSGSDNEGHFAQLILTLGLSLVISNGAMIMAGSSSHTVQTTLASSSWTLGPFTSDDILIFINRARAIGCVIATIIGIGLYLFIHKTQLGTTMRAAADNSTAATIVGIDVDRAYGLAFAIGTAVTAIAGGLIATYYPFQPYIGFDFVIIMYAGVVLGGLGSMLGAFWGGMTMGLVQQLSTLILPYQLQNAAIFLLFLAVVLWPPLAGVASANPAPMIYELRTYRALPGRLQPLLDRFALKTLPLWEKAGIRQAGFWTTLVGPSHLQLTYLLAWQSLAEREAKWNAFQADPEWKAALAQSEEDGRIVENVENAFLQPAAFSAVQ